jgi:pimeloyl-ACP methyl ester carboxylesterase
LLAATTGAIYQSVGEARDLRAHSPPGEMVDVGGHSLHLDCAGEPATESAPTVILDAGLGGYSQDWVWVQPQVAEFARVCAYDRAGYAWSDPGPMPRDSGQIVAELHALLSEAGVPPPYVLVGQSFGGLNARFYARQYPDEVAGVVLVDATPDCIYDDPAFSASQHGDDRGEILLFRTVTVLSRYGILRLFVQLAGTKPLTFLEDYPPEIHSDILAVVFLHTQYYEAVVAELETFEDSTRQVQVAPPDPDVPYIVIARRLLSEQDGPEVDPAQEQAWRRLQTELAESAPNGALVIAEESDHVIHMCQPDVVVDAIRQIVEPEVR